MKDKLQHYNYKHRICLKNSTFIGATKIYKPLCASYGLKYPGILAAQPFYEVSANFPNTLSNVCRIDNNLGGLKYGGGSIPYSTRGLKVPSNETGGNYCHFTSIGNYYYAHIWNIGHRNSLYSSAK